MTVSLSFRQTHLLLSLSLFPLPASSLTHLIINSPNTHLPFSLSYPFFPSPSLTHTLISIPPSSPFRPSLHLFSLTSLSVTFLTHAFGPFSLSDTYYSLPPSLPSSPLSSPSPHPFRSCIPSRKIPNSVPSLTSVGAGVKNSTLQIFSFCP